MSNKYELSLFLLSLKKKIFDPFAFPTTLSHTLILVLKLIKHIQHI